MSKSQGEIMFIKLADWFVYGILGLSGVTKLGKALHFFVYDVMKILFLLFVVITLISFLRSYINNQRIKSFIEKQPKFLANFLASVFGAITPFCSCSSIPVFIGFIESGLPFGVAMSFLITSPMINEIAVVLLCGVIGIKITIVYVVTGLLVGTFGGFVMEIFGYKKYLQDYLFKLEGESIGFSCSCSKNNDKAEIKDRILNSLIYANTLLKKIFLFVILGVALGAFLHGYVPQEFFMKYMQPNNLFAVPLAVICGIPLYSDASSIIPIAQVLIQKGCAVGTVLVFMMAVVALSLPEMIILSKVMKKELIIRYCFFMAIIFICVGYLYNLIY